MDNKKINSKSDIVSLDGEWNKRINDIINRKPDTKVNSKSDVVNLDGDWNKRINDVINKKPDKKQNL